MRRREKSLERIRIRSTVAPAAVASDEEKKDKERRNVSLFSSSLKFQMKREKRSK